MSIMSINQFEWSEHEISQMNDVIQKYEWIFNTDKLLKKEDVKKKTKWQLQDEI